MTTDYCVMTADHITDYWIPPMSPDYWWLKNLCMITDSLLIIDEYLLITDYWLLVTDYGLLITDYRLLTTDCWLMTTDCWLLVADDTHITYWLLTTNYSLMITDYWLLTIDYGLLAAFYQLLAVNYLWLTTDLWLLTTGLCSRVASPLPKDLKHHQVLKAQRGVPIPDHPSHLPKQTGEWVGGCAEPACRPWWYSSELENPVP